MNLANILEPIKNSLFWKLLVRLFNNVYFLASLVLTPIVLMSPLTDVFFDDCTRIACNTSAQPELRKLKLQNGQEVEVLRTATRRFMYPEYSMYTGLQTSVEVTYDIDLNGHTENISGFAATSNLKKFFEQEAINYVEGLKFSIPRESEVKFPITNLKITIPFILGDANGDVVEAINTVDYWKILAAIFLFLLFTLIVTGFRSNAAIQFISDTSIPFGALFGLLFLNDAIFVGITTNFVPLAEALLIFSSFGLIAAISNFYADSTPQQYKLVPFKLFLLVVIVVEMHFALQEPGGRSILRYFFDPRWGVPETIAWWIERPTVFYFQKNHIWQISILANINKISSFFFFIVLAAGVFHFKKRKDLSVFILSALFAGGLSISATMFLWFKDFSAIQANYVNLLDVAHIGSTALTYVALSFLIVHLVSLGLNNLAIPNWRRMNFYFIEIMTFFLFFVYAPVSLSELGISYEEDLESDENIERLENEIKELREILKQNNLMLTPTES